MASSIINGHLDRCTLCTATVIKKSDLNRVMNAYLKEEGFALYVYGQNSGEGNTAKFICLDKFPEETDIPLLGKDLDYILIQIEHLEDVNIKNGVLSYESMTPGLSFGIAHRIGEKLFLLCADWEQFINCKFYEKKC